jgi:hypothetical protein
MHRRHRQSRTGALSIGWLFADLLLALAMLFLLTNINKLPAVKAVARATPTPSPTPLPTQAPPRLELKHHRITLVINATGLLNNDKQASDDVKRQIRNLSILKGRSVGLAIAYGGAPDTSDNAIRTAQNIALKIYAILNELGQERFAFTHASYYDPLYLLGG